MIGTAVLLSGSTSGRPIKLTAITTPGTLIHTAVSGSVIFDEVHLWVTNTLATEDFLTIEWGGTTNPDDRVLFSYLIPGRSSSLKVIDGFRLNGGLVIRAFCPTANALLITGNVNRLS